MIIDTHAHLDYADFEADFSEVLARAETAGVRRIVTIGTSLESSRRAISLAEKFSNVFAVVGVHPTSAGGVARDIVTPLRELAENPRVVAIGETGLDYHRPPDGVLKDAYKWAQATLFQQQLDLAAELKLNVVIHQRDAWEDTLAILQNYTGKLRGVFHCFGNTFAQAQEIIRLGHLVSFTGTVTFKNAPLVHECAARVAAGDFMVETDCPYLAPAPFRGQRCEPAHTRLVAEKIAALREVSVEEIARQTTENAHRFFSFDRR